MSVLVASESEATLIAPHLNYAVRVIHRTEIKVCIRTEHRTWERRLFILYTWRLFSKCFEDVAANISSYCRPRVSPDDRPSWPWAVIAMGRHGHGWFGSRDVWFLAINESRFIIVRYGCFQVMYWISSGNGSEPRTLDNKIRAIAAR